VAGGIELASLVHTKLLGLHFDVQHNADFDRVHISRRDQTAVKKYPAAFSNKYIKSDFEPILFSPSAVVVQTFFR
jgi:hypothetical protein